MTTFKPMGWSTKQSEAVENSQAGITEVGVNCPGFIVQRFTLENPVAVMEGETLRIEPISETEALVSIFDTVAGIGVNTKMKIKMEGQA